MLRRIIAFLITGQILWTPATSWGKKVQGIDREIDVGGRILHCRIFGSGEPAVVLLSGFNCSQYYWDGIVHSIAKKTTVITYDRAGYGESEIGDGPVDGMHASRDLRNLLKKLPVTSPFVVVGHSYGGRIARRFAAGYPELLHSLVLIDSIQEDWLEDFESIMTEEEREFFEQDFESQSNSSYTGSSGAMRESREFKTTEEQLRKIKIRLHVPLVILTAGNRIEYRFRRYLRKQAHKRYLMVLAKNQKRLLTFSTNSKQVIVPRSGHHIHRDRPNVVIRTILDLVKNLK
jgi:pimeloyl-ACP methyl ester carboxylesterase